MKKMSSIVILMFAMTVIVGTAPVSACTNFLITKGASVDGSTMISYSADSHVLYGELYHWPAADHIPGSMLDVYEWDTGKHLGQIKQVAHTYNVAGLINEHQVAIGETTWGGRSELSDSTGVVDYGSLMFLALQRAKTAREAIRVMAELVAEYGYYSSGESMSIADPEEVWIFEIIGKGPGNTGAVWVARRIPDGYICAHANQARIRTFPLADGRTSITSEQLDKLDNTKVTTVYAADVIDVAREKGYFDGADEDFSFADAYAPADFGALRFCEARVYAMFNRAAPSLNLPTDYIKGNVHAEPLPLWIKPDYKISVRHMMEFMRDHFEGTVLDMTQDIGAGPYKLPYRWRPLTWRVDGVQYCNERATSTQQTGFSFVTQSRSWLPDPVGGIIWFGVDDTFSTVYNPIYCSITRVPASYAVGVADMLNFSWNSAFWVFNWVANWAYSRYSDMIKDIQVVQRELGGGFLGDQPGVDQAAKALYEKSPRQAVEYLTDYSCKTAEATVERWRKLGTDLIVKYMDGNIKDELGQLNQPGYPEEWYRAIAKDTGDHLKVIPSGEGSH